MSPTHPPAVRRSSFLFAGLALLCAGPAARGQGSPPYREIWRLVGPAADSFFSHGLAPLGDITGDGVVDVAVGLALGPGGTPGELWYLSGRDGRILRRTSAENMPYALAPAGDLDGDGGPDVLLYDAQQQVVRGYSGADGRILFARFSPAIGGPVHFGWAMGAISDLDRDGWREVVVASPWEDHGSIPQGGTLRVFSGRTGQEIRLIPPARNEVQFGRSMAIAGDLNGDGVEDIVAGAPAACRLDVPVRTCPPADWAAGQVTAFSGATGQRLWSVRGLQGNDRLGMAVAAIGDVDGDGVPDIVAGAYPPDIFVAPRPGYVMVLSGRTGAVLGIARNDQPIPNLYDAMGFAVAGVGDVDGDGYPDFAASWVEEVIPPGLARWVGRVTVFSGRDLSTLLVLRDDQPGTVFGNKIFGMGTVDGTDFPALLAARHGWGQEWRRGAVHVVSLAPPRVDSLGEPCNVEGNPPPRLGVSGSPTAGRPLPVHVASQEPAFTSLLLVGASHRQWGSVPLPLDLTGSGLPGCWLLVAPHVLLAAASGPRGSATHTLAIPNTPALQGASFFLQGIVFGTGGPAHPAFTRALRCTVELP